MRRSTLALGSTLAVMLFLAVAGVANADATAVCFVTEATGTCGPTSDPITIECADGTQGPSYIQTAAPETAKCANALPGAGGKKTCTQGSVTGSWLLYGCPEGTWGQIATSTKVCRNSTLGPDDCKGPQPVEPQER